MRAFFVLLGLMAGSAWAQEPSPPESHSSKREIGLQVGHALNYDGAEDFGIGGMGARVQWFERVGKYMALGLETALYKDTGSTFSITLPGHHLNIAHKPLFQLGGVWRVEVTQSLVRPAFLLGMAWHKGNYSRFALSMGAEVAVRAGKRVLLVADGRIHVDVRKYAEFEDHYRTFGLGLRLVL
jgi:hypothetical protein